MADEKIDKAQAISRYKAQLKALLDERPSGLRGQLAIALGKHKSFISQITNPSYRVPIPASDLQTIFDVCYLSKEEREAFLGLYNRAHALDIELSALDSRVISELRIAVPAFHNPLLTKEIEKVIKDFADRMIALARKIDAADESSAKR